MKNPEYTLRIIVEVMTVYAGCMICYLIGALIMFINYSDDEEKRQKISKRYRGLSKFLTIFTKLAYNSLSPIIKPS